jgi:glycosyltransferase involved in cell wall biosynthesis
MVGQQETGNESYVVGLLQGLAQVEELAVAAAVQPGIDLPHQIRDDRIAVLPLPRPGNWSRLLVGMNQLCREWRADVLHVSYVAPVLPICPTVVSVHDVSFKRYPAYFSCRNRLLLATLLPWSLRQAAAVITLSNHALSEITHFFPWISAPIVAIPLAADPCFRSLSPEVIQDVRYRYDLPDRYVLAVGNLQPRKNLTKLIEAFALICPEELDIQLLVVGQDWWQGSAIYRRVQELGLAERVQFTGYVPQEDLVGLYNAATVLVYPSVYEGFGLPVLEAMACGRPVIASNASSLPEVAGEAAVLVNPLDARDLAEAIRTLLGDEVRREKFGRRGRQRAGQFSWHQTALKTAGVYRKVSGYD